MTQDFAKIRPEPLLETQVVQAPPAWSLMLTGIVVGIAVGIFACIMFYLSGNVPPLNQGATNGRSRLAATPETANQAIEAESGEPEITLEFYRELQDYEVEVDAVPVELTRLQAGDTSLERAILLQTGAFESRESAERARQNQENLGLQVFITQQQSTSRSKYLVQSGPYTDLLQLQAAEQVLGGAGIQHFRLRPQ
jgi:cell division protein FtsN